MDWRELKNTNEPTALRPAPVLVVDDDAAALMMMDATLANPVLEIVCVASGAEALLKLEEREYALVLLDVHMPLMDGFETASRIRERPNSARTPIIFVTGIAPDSARTLRGFGVGAVDYQFKPVDPVILRSKVAVFAELFRFRIAEAERHAAALQEISDELNHQQQLSDEFAYQATHDVLTGLPNRYLLDDLLEEAIKQARRSKRGLAVAFIDLDRFKVVNDTLGHFTGDRLLQKVAQRLRATLRESDVVARIGGDEFVVVLGDLADAADAGRSAQKLIDAFAGTNLLKTYSLPMTLSIGISVWPTDGEDGETLMNHADGALYEAKRAGRNTYRFCVPEMTKRAHHRITLESQLRTAIARNEFILHYQPQALLAGGAIVAAEALIRWNSPTRGLVMPAEFIPIAEEAGLLLNLGEWVISAACRQLRAWRDAGVMLGSVAVNVSPRQLHGERLGACVRAALAENGLSPASLEIEVTETASLFDSEESLAVLRRLKDIGVRISLDDFGTGYSSLVLLTRRLFDTIKIDQSFMKGIPANAENSAIAAALVVLARRLGLAVVAEGVSNVEQIAFLRELGCDLMQGEWLSMPIPNDECAALVMQHNSVALSPIR